MSSGPYPWANNPTNTSDEIADQSESTYKNYSKIKGFEDVGYFLVSYVVSGGVVMPNAARNDAIDASNIVVSINNDIVVRDGISFTISIPSTVYYLDFTAAGDWSWGTVHPSGVQGTDYLTIASVMTNGSTLVSSISDTRGSVGGFRLKDGIGIPNLLIDGGDFLNTVTYPDYDAGQF